MKKVMMIAAVVVMSVGFYTVDTTTDNTKLYDIENAVATDGEDGDGDPRGNDA